MRISKYFSCLVILVFFSLSPVSAMTEPVEILDIYHEGALISVQLADYSLADRDREDCFVLFTVISPTGDPFDIQAAILLFETALGGTYYCFWILENPYFSATWHLGYINEYFFVNGLQFDFLFSEYISISSSSTAILSMAGIFPQFPVSSQTNDFSPILEEYAYFLMSQNVSISPPDSTTSTTSNELSSTTTDSVASGIGVTIGISGLISVFVIRLKRKQAK